MATHNRSGRAKALRRLKKRTKLLTGCPQCGAPVRKVAGLERCDNGHALYAFRQTHTYPSLNQIDHTPDNRPRDGLAPMGSRVMPTPGSDDQ